MNPIEASTLAGKSSQFKDHAPFAPTFELLSPQERLIESQLVELFPQLAGTEVPSIVTGSIDLVAKHCALNENGHPHLFGRGSWVSRSVLPTHPNYWLTPTIFREIIEQDPILVGNGEALACASHLGQGPDIDLMYLLQPGHTDQDVFSDLQSWAEQKNQDLLTKGYRIELAPAALANWNGSEDARVYTQVSILRQLASGEWESLLRVDYGKEPTKDELYLDGRLSGYMTWVDLWSYTEVEKNEEGEWSLILGSDMQQELRFAPNNTYFINPPRHLAYVIGSRFLQQTIWYSQEPLAHLIKRQSSGELDKMTRSSFPLRQYFFTGLPGQAISPKDKELYSMRRQDIAGWLLLAATNDPFRTLEIGNAIGLLRTSTYHRQGIYRELLKLYQPSLERKTVYFEPDQLETLGDYYQSMLPEYRLRNAEFIGPLAIVQAARNLKYLPPNTPVSLKSYLDMVMPRL